MLRETLAADAAHKKQASEEEDWSRNWRLIVVSNRVAETPGKGAGGLAVAVGEALSQSNGLWFGWSGQISGSAGSAGPRHTETSDFATLTVDLTQQEYDDYYLGFSNECLWPLFHYRLDLARIDRSQLKTYFAVNERLAKALLPTIRSDDLIWVHDYHLIPYASYLRRHGVKNRIGFFLHIPFPPPEVFAALPDHKKLARMLFAYDLVAFQTVRDRENFVRYAQEQLGAERLNDGRLKSLGRIIKADAIPIGIDAGQFTADARRNAQNPDITAIANGEPDHKLIVGVDRLDYSKGLPERIEAMDLFLTRWPQYREKVTYLQVAPPSRETIAAYMDVRSAVERALGNINGRHGTLRWSPVRYLNSKAERPFLAGLLRRSHVGLITPLRDGMNLVAKEFVAAQNPADPGVLILSHFAGAAEQLDQAILVNPHDTESMAQAIREALEMPLSERQARHALLLDRVRSENIGWWRRQFMRALISDEPRTERLLSMIGPASTLPRTVVSPGRNYAGLIPD